jgi:hypothetical protein
MSFNDPRTEFATRGFTTVRGALTSGEVETCIERLEALSGRRRESRASGAWTLPDGVSKERVFWPLIVKEALVETVRRILGPETRFLQHTDLHVGFSATTWHRDCVNRHYGYGPDWNEIEEPYRIVRVGIYLQSFAESRFALRLQPGSHRPSSDWSPDERKRERRQKVWAQALALLAGTDPLAEGATAVATDPGDAILFDPRLLHSGSPVSGPKYSVFLGYGVPNRHFARHAAYYRSVRRELGYEDLHPELVELLRRHDLYAEPEPHDSLTGAYRPSGMQRLLGRRLRPAVRGLSR